MRERPLYMRQMPPAGYRGPDRSDLPSEHRRQPVHTHRKNLLKPYRDDARARAPFPGARSPGCCIL